MDPSSTHAERIRRPLRFPNWRQVLQASTVPALLRRDYESAILQFLQFCRDTHATATAQLARDYLEARAGRNVDREALRWFFRVGWQWQKLAAASPPTAPVPGPRSDIPPKAKEDLGGADWERDLIKAMRERGFLRSARKRAGLLGSKPWRPSCPWREARRW